MLSISRACISCSLSDNGCTYELHMSGCCRLSDDDDDGGGGNDDGDDAVCAS